MRIWVSGSGSGNIGGQWLYVIGIISVLKRRQEIGLRRALGATRALWGS